MALPEKLTFSTMTFDLLESKHGLRQARHDEVLFPDVAPVDPSPVLVEEIKRSRKLKMVNERARAYYLIAPVLTELLVLRPGLVALPEVQIEVKGAEGLSGSPDFLITDGNVRKVSPILTVVEAKKDDTDTGLAQCAAEMLATYMLNQSKPNPTHGCVTTGYDWKFLRLDGARKMVRVDLDVYLINELPTLLGVLCAIVDAALLEFPTSDDAV